MFTFLEYHHHAVLTGYTGNERKVEIPALYNGKTVRELGMRAFASTTVEEVVLPNRLEVIGMGCFENCYELETIQTPVSLRTVGYMAVAGSRLSAFECDTEELVLETKAFGRTEAVWCCWN